MKFILRLIPLFLLFFSCSSTDLHKGELSYFITDEKRVELLSPSLLGETRSIQQFVQGRYGDNEYSLMAVVQLKNEAIFIQGLTAMGTSLFEITYRENQVDYSGSNRFPQDTALYILADYQLCYYPASLLEGSLEKSGIRFEEILSSSGWERDLYDGEEKIISIRREGQMLLFTNILRNYSYNIEEADF
jgi:hypothetical protein